MDLRARLIVCRVNTEYINQLNVYFTNNANEINRNGIEIEKNKRMAFVKYKDVKLNNVRRKKRNVSVY